jgi:hypothetical protein
MENLPSQCQTKRCTLTDQTTVAAASPSRLNRLSHVIVYGSRAGRIYRLVNAGGTFEEVKPDWTETLHGKVSDFLVRAPGKVSIEEPQTLMASIRADGPETEA